MNENDGVFRDSVGKFGSGRSEELSSDYGRTPTNYYNEQSGDGNPPAPPTPLPGAGAVWQRNRVLITHVTVNRPEAASA